MVFFVHPTNFNFSPIILLQAKTQENNNRNGDKKNEISLSLLEVFSYFWRKAGILIIDWFLQKCARSYPHSHCKTYQYFIKEPSLTKKILTGGDWSLWIDWCVISMWNFLGSWRALEYFVFKNRILGCRNLGPRVFLLLGETNLISCLTGLDQPWNLENRNRNKIDFGSPDFYISLLPTTDFPKSWSFFQHFEKCKLHFSF